MAASQTIPIIRPARRRFAVVKSRKRRSALPSRKASEILSIPPESGVSVVIHYYGYRYFHTNLGRWLSRDPIGEQGGSNLYAFVGNDGVNQIDLYGLQEQPPPPLRPLPDFNKAKVDPTKPKECFCCCADDLQITSSDVLPTDPDNPSKVIGTIFSATFKTSWVKTTKDKEGVCSLKWEEIWDHTPSMLLAKGAKNNQWYDATQLSPTNSLFTPFITNNTQMGLGGTMRDPAVIPSGTTALTQNRSGQIRVTIGSTPGCTCGFPSKVVTVSQKIDVARNSVTSGVVSNPENK